MEIQTTNLDELPSNNINLSTTEKNELINKEIQRLKVRRRATNSLKDYF